MRVIFFCTLLLVRGAPCLGGEIHVITVGSTDYHQARLKLEIPAFYPDLNGVFGDARVEMDFAGTFEIPRLAVPPEALKKVWVKSRFINAAAAAGPDGFFLSFKMEHDLPAAEFESPGISESISGDGGHNVGGVAYNLGPAIFISNAPGRFSSASASGTVNVPVKAFLVALGSHATANYDIFSRRYALCFHRSPLFEVIYELNDGFALGPDVMPVSDENMRTWGDVQAIEPIANEDISGFPFPGELVGQPIAQDLISHGAKKFDIRITGLPGYRYSLHRSVNLEHPVFVESKDGDGRPLSFEIDDSMRSDPAAFFQVQASKVAAP